MLTSAQECALRHVRSRALRDADVARERVARVTGGAFDVPLQGDVALNFHPDRIAADGRIVIEALLADGIYRSQFETRISNGGLSAFPGGDRDRWEERLFGGAYHGPGVAPEDRPKYGGLNLVNHADGPCPRYGSCHVRLREHVLPRATFCFGDSHLGPRDVGTIDAFDSVLAGLLEEIETGHALGRAMTVQSLLDRDFPRVQGRALDHYIEAQVHGVVELGRDADMLVADPSFEGTAIGSALVAVATRYGLELGWHDGYSLDAADVPAEFRGPAIPVLAARIAREFGSTRMHAELIGRAARSVVTERDRWRDWAAPAETLQHIKQLWHVLVRFGARAGE